MTAPKRIWIAESDLPQLMRNGLVMDAPEDRAEGFVNEDMVQDLVEALERIVQWSEAYPESVFPKPDFARAAEALSKAGMTLDAISADNMRHATHGCGNIARAALAKLQEAD